MTSPEEHPTDVVERAKAALEGVAPLPWTVDPDAYYLSDDDGMDNDRYWDVDGPNGGWMAHCQDLPAAQFVAASRSLVPELVAELESARSEARALRSQLIDSDSALAASESYLSREVAENAQLRRQTGCCCGGCCL